MGSAGLKSTLDLVRGVDAFPYQVQEPDGYANFVKPYYQFRIEGFRSVFGLIPQSAIENIEWSHHWTLDHASRCLTLTKGDGQRQRSAWFAGTIESAQKSGKIPALKTLRGESSPVYDEDCNLVLSIDRAASCLFGTVAYGVQMLAYVKTEEGIRHWIPRRSRTKKSYPGMLDNCVGGGLSTGESPLETLVREAAEEASLPEDYVRKNAKPFGTLSYHMDRDGNGLEGHQPQVQYVYELELTPDIIPTPLDGEVEKFEKTTLEEVQQALSKGQFKTNCAVTWIGWLVKEGIINSENEKSLYEICARIHRRLDFPTV